MNVYKDLEDRLYDLAESLLPKDFHIRFDYTNVPKGVDPYLVIDVGTPRAIGQGYSSSLVTEAFQSKVTTVDYQAKVTFEFFGKYDRQTTLSEIALEFHARMHSPRANTFMRLGNLSLLDLGDLERFADPRVTDTFMRYQTDCEFAFSIEISDDVDIISGVGIDGVYNDAGRDGNVIYTHIDIPQTQNP